jgi:hypothetical protein
MAKMSCLCGHRDHRGTGKLVMVVAPGIEGVSLGADQPGQRWDQRADGAAICMADAVFRRLPVLLSNVEAE